MQKNKVEDATILLPSKGSVVDSIIWDLHVGTQVFKLMSLLRKEYYIIKVYSTIKRVIKNCLLCKRLHGRAIKPSPAAYENIRMRPFKVPFRDVFVDFMGPFFIKSFNGSEKVYVCIFTCLYTRAINLLMVPTLKASHFRLILQRHINENGTIARIVSDNGTNLVSGIRSFN